MMQKSQTTNLEIIPARMLNEFAYCPRLFYLEYVQSQFEHNADTLDGRLTHRRVDTETGHMPVSEELDESSKLHARSVVIGSDKLGAIARIDLIDVQGKKVIPVDYKRGASPDIPEGAYEPERVQICLQGMLLRDNGYECDEGIIYFVQNQQHIKVPFTDSLIQRTTQLLEEARKCAETNQIPPPLINSAKCPRCSLVGICLPDEVNLLNQLNKPIDGTEPSKAHTPKGFVRRLVPARDDRLAVYVQGQGYSIGLKGEVLEIRDKGKTIEDVKLIDISQVNLYGNVQLSAQALRELAIRDIPIIHLSYGGWLIAVTTPIPNRNIDLRQRQFNAATSNTHCLKLAKAFVSGKIKNSRTLLRRNAPELPNEILLRLAQWKKRVETVNDVETLLGIEGNAARDYFSAFSLMFKPPSTDKEPFFDFNGRNRRPPRDPVNAILSFLYSLLMKELFITAISVGFDPYLGFYHRPKYGRPALALDLMEEFRPLIVDSVTISLINNGEIKLTDFISRAGAYAMTEAARKKVIGAYERRLNSLVTHPMFGYSISYRRIFEVQARLLTRYLLGEIEEYIPFCTR